MRRRPAALAAALAFLALLAGCGSSSHQTLTVSAAASLKPPLTKLGGARYQFAGSDLLAAQIEQGVRPDVFAAANPKLPAALYAKGLVEAPVTFAANRLVIAVPASGGRVRTLADLERPGVSVAIGSPTVPIGAYTRTVLARLGPAAARILANVRTEEPDVSGIVGKLIAGAAQAGFTYLTDVRATRGQLRAISIPSRLQPTVAYAAAVLRGSGHAAQARAFVASLRSGPGQRQLRAAGFLPPPA